jgi:tetratricopeptide (TPR) repeat protein
MPGLMGIGLTQGESAQAWFERARTLEEHSVGKAGQAYHAAIRIQPSFVDAHINLGLLHHNAGKLREAEACYRRALRYAPDRALEHFNLGVVLEDQEKKQGAIAAYQEALCVADLTVSTMTRPCIGFDIASLLFLQVLSDEASRVFFRHLVSD